MICFGGEVALMGILEKLSIACGWGNHKFAVAVKLLRTEEDIYLNTYWGFILSDTTRHIPDDSWELT